MQQLAEFHALLSNWQVYVPIIATVLVGMVAAKMPATALYVGLIPFINWSFSVVPNVALPFGGQFQPLAIVTGLVLVVRDFAQREIGHRILGAMGLGLVFSTMTTPLNIVVASGVAFLASELVDWAVYTFNKRPLSQRILLSSVASAPLDSALFLSLASMFSPVTFIAQVVSKLTGAVVVSQLVAARERKSSSGTLG